ncbi:hypothetical protein SOVF_094750 isoform B [Spinacia oleracea]|nr:hypothetical protein SOVF_094750 isoform B [Spinacia oleracea]
MGDKTWTLSTFRGHEDFPYILKIWGGEVADEVNEKIYIAVSKDWKACKSALEWVVRNSKGKGLCLVHVHQPAQFISILGGRFPISSLSEQEVMAHREQERQDMCKILDEYLLICTKAQVKVEKLYIEMKTVESGLVELISQYKIERLVMGAAADRSYSRCGIFTLVALPSHKSLYCDIRKMMKPKSKKAKYVRQYAPTFCHIWFICKGHLIYTREGTKQSRLNDEDQKRQASSKARLSQLTSDMSNSLSRAESEGSFSRSSTFSLSQISVFSRSSEAATDSTFYHSGTEDRELSFRSLVLSPKPEGGKQHQSPSPNTVEGNTDDRLYDQLDQAIAEAEAAKLEAFQESMRRRRAEKDAIEAIRTANAADSLYYEELRRRQELEDELAKTKEILESTKMERDMALDELRVAVDQKLLLKNRAEKSDMMGEELEDNLISALELLQSIKKL